VFRTTEQTLNAALRRKLRRLGQRRVAAPQWDVMYIHRHSHASTDWESLKHGSHDAAAVAPVTINGRTYWAVGRMVTDGEKALGYLLVFGLLGGLFVRPKPEIAIWKEDPRVTVPSGQHFYNGQNDGAYAWAVEEIERL
jgi:hypothetical protein